MDEVAPGLLVHCSAGAPRSPSVAAAALARHEVVEVEAAFDRVASRREAVDPHPALVRRAVVTVEDVREDRD